MRKTFIFFIFLFAVFIVDAQENFFSDSGYIAELNQFLSPIYSVHPEAKTEYEKLKENWNSGSIEDLKFGIVYISNTMKDARLKPYPQFYYYIATLNSLIEQNNIDYYREWEVGFLSILNENRLQTKVITDFLRFSLLLIRDSVLTQNASTTWKINSKNYEIGNDPDNGIFVSFDDDFTLYCIANSGVDTFSVKQVAGICYPIKKTFIGRHGRITWERYGYAPREEFSKFQDFKIDMSKGEFSVQNAVYTNSKLGIYQIPGDLKVKLLYNKSEDKSLQFRSYNAEILKKVLPETQINGYVLVKGKTIFATGDKNTKAVLSIRSKGKNVATVRSSNFKIIPDSLIKTYTSDFSFYLNNHLDSLYNSDIEVTYKKGLIPKDTNFLHNRTIFNPKWFSFNAREGYFLIVSRKSTNSNEMGIYDSYNKVDIFSDRMVWKKDDDTLYFVTTIGANSGQFVVRSDRYYDYKLYNKYVEVGTYYINYLFEIKILYDSVAKYGMTINPKMFQERLFRKFGKKLTLQEVKNLFKDLYYDGFLDYNLKTLQATATPKLYRYLQNAERYTKKDKTLEDYDYLQIVSQNSSSNFKQLNIGTNAIYNLKTNELIVKNVLPFKLSPTVVINTNQIVIGKDRNFRFGGSVRAGFLNFKSPEFLYDYRNNEINVSDSSVMSMLFIDTVINRKISIDSIYTKIQNVKGKIHIAEPNNKSLVNVDKSYPKFVSSSTSKIYYNNFLSYMSDTSKFHFQANQFEMDSLNYITKKRLKFSGNMHTGLLNAPLPVTLTVKQTKDLNYLGFRKCVGKTDSTSQGLKFKDGHFYGCIYLNQIGLFGDGQIEYASAIVYGKGMAFKPREVEGLMDSVKIGIGKSNEDIPSILGLNLNMDWLGSMKFSNVDSKSHYYIYTDLPEPADLNGSLYYTKNKVFVDGDFIFKDATLVSNQIDLKRKEFTVDSCDFILKNKETSSSVFKTNDLNGRVDISKQMGAFFSNADTSAIYFKDNNYLCFMDHFLWKIGDGIVDIGGIMQGEDSTRYAQSVEEKQTNKDKKMRLYGTILQNTIDTLTFNAATTIFDINSKKITATKVPELKISDAKIVPSQDVVIGLKGAIEKIENCEVSFPYPIFSDKDTIPYKHYFYHASVYIKHRFNYNADSAIYYYPYKHQAIVFSIQSKDAIAVFKRKSKLKELPYSYAKRHYSAGNRYWLNPYIATTGEGDFILSAKNQYPQISGYARIDTALFCSGKKPQEFKFDLITINTDTVILPISFYNESRFTKHVFSGITWNYKYFAGNNHYKIFDGFIDDIDTGKQVIYKPSGNLYFNKKKNEYRISSNKDLLFEPMGMDTLPGDYMAFNKDQCIYTSQGEYNLFNNWKFSKAIEFTSTFRGVYRHNMSTKTQQFQGVLTLSVPVPDIITDRLTESILANDENEDMTMEQNKYLNIYLGKQQAQELYEGSMPDKFKKATFVLSNVSFKMAANGDTLYTPDAEFELVAIKGKLIRRKVKAFISYVHTPRTSYYVLIIKPNNKDIYAFRYNVNQSDNRQYLYIYLRTPDQKFNNTIANMKSKEKSLKNNFEFHEANWEDITQYAKQFE